MRRGLRSAYALSLASLLFSGVARAESVDPTGPDGVYGRFDGDIDFGLALGAELDEAPRGAARLSIHYFSIAGIYSSYRDALGVDHESADRRLLSLGIDLRPAFIPRWARDMQHGPSYLDLMVDSISLALGAYWAEPPGADFGATRGFEASLGAGLPLFGTAPGLWLEARGSLRWNETGGGAQPSALLLVSFHAFALSPLLGE
jgi:hypothetical protein